MRRGNSVRAATLHMNQQLPSSPCMMSFASMESAKTATSPLGMNSPGRFQQVRALAPGMPTELANGGKAVSMNVPPDPSLARTAERQKEVSDFSSVT